MRPRRFAVTRPRRGRAVRTPVGSTVAWSVEEASTLRIQVQRRAARGRWSAVGTIAKRAPKGTGTLRFGGKVAGRRLAPGSYRLVAVARSAGATSAPKSVTFTVVRG